MQGESLPVQVKEPCSSLHDCCNGPKFSDRQAWARSADPDQTAPDQGLHCLQFCLHLFDALLYGKNSRSNFRVITANFSGVRIFRIFTVLVGFHLAKLACTMYSCS